MLSIEPTENALRLLRGNINRNGVDGKVVVFEGVASESSGSATINCVAGREEYSSLGPMLHPSIRGEPYETRPVTATTIDALVDLHNLDPGFLKIDVEGSEHRVLRGCTETLRKCRPVILSELTDSLLRANGSSAAEVISFLESFDYEIWDPADPGARVGTRSFETILCIPVHLRSKH